MSDSSAAPSAPGWGRPAFVRFESAVPNRHGRHPGLFAMLRGLRQSGRLDAEAATFAAEMIGRSYALHTEPSPDVYAEPGAQGWFRSQMDGGAAAGLRELTADIIGLLDDHGIVIRTVWTDHPGVLTYEDPVQVVAVAPQFPDDWPFDRSGEPATTPGSQHDQLQVIADDSSGQSVDHE